MFLAMCEWAHVCDHAFFDRQGKLCLIGVVETILVDSLPATHPRLALAYHISGESDAVAELRVTLLEPDDRRIFKADSTVALGPAGQHNGVLHLNDIPLTKGGLHRFTLLVDGSSETEVCFLVVRALEEEG